MNLIYYEIILSYTLDCSSKLDQLNSIMAVLRNIETLLNSSFENSEESVKTLASSISVLVNHIINEVQYAITKQINDCSISSSISGIPDWSRVKIQQLFLGICILSVYCWHWNHQYLWEMDKSIFSIPLVWCLIIVKLHILIEHPT